MNERVKADRHSRKDRQPKASARCRSQKRPVEEMNPHEKRASMIEKPGFTFLLLGVFLPAAALLTEYATHYLARHYFDPFPTLYHFLLFSLVPISNLLAWLSVRANVSALYSVTALASGMSLGVCILYTLMLLPLAGQLVFLMPAGALGIAPLLAIPFCLHAGNIICGLASRQDSFFDAHQVKHLGHVIILLMVVAVELPSTLTRIHLSEAVSRNSSESVRAVDWLRSWGSREVLLRACYERSGRATDIVGSLYEHQHPVSIDQARRVYYMVTGTPFNSVEIPGSFRATIQHAGLIDDPAQLNANADDEFDLDADIAGEKVSGVARGLRATASSLKGKVYPEASYASLDWNFSFANVSRVPREARAKIILPDGAVVTKATMWIDGVERQATIMPRGQARATYETAVREHKRDPLLVSTAGKDIVLVQCYPVLAGSDTKLSLHIVAPLAGDKNKQSLTMPAFAERNFGFSEACKVDIGSRQPLTILGATLKDNALGGAHALTGELPNSLLSRFETVLEAEGGNTSVAFNDPVSHNARVLRTDLARLALRKPDNLVIVIDKSNAMQPYMEAVATGLAGLDREIVESIVVIQDNDHKIYSRQENNLDSALASLKNEPCRGGQIDSTFLARALAYPSYLGLTEAPDILWIHASQPIAGEADATNINFTIANGSPRLWDLQVASGPNAVLSDSNYSDHINRVPREGKLEDDIKNLFRLWAGPAPADQSPPANIPVEIKNPEKAFELAQIVANQEVLALYLRGATWQAGELARQYHLITPATSAVVTDEEILKKYEPSRSDIPTSDSSVIMGVNTAGKLRFKNPVDAILAPHIAKLDSLSMAAGSAGGSGDDYSSAYNPSKDYEMKMGVSEEPARELAGRPSQPTSGLIPAPASSPVASYGDTGASGGPGEGAVGRSLRMEGLEKKEMEMPRRRAKTSSDSLYLNSKNKVLMEADEAQSGAEWSMAPTLQGATNGTIGPQEEAGFEQELNEKAGLKQNFCATPAERCGTGNCSNLRALFYLVLIPACMIVSFLALRAILGRREDTGDGW
ncbi:MAG: VIT domain-containing protein [Candidatus Obscuribacterales bacterium]